MILNFSSFAKTEISKTSNFLFHGENQGRIEERSSIVINSIKKKFEAINYIYLSSDEASFVTGSTIHVNGGMGMF